MKWKYLLVCLVAGLCVSATTTVLTQSSPTSAPRVQAGDVKYLGSFNLPTIITAPNETTYGGSALGIGPNNTLYFGGHNWYQRLCQATIPNIGGTASLVGNCADVNGNWGSSDRLGGTLLYNGRLIVSKFTYYDATMGATVSHAAGRPDRTNFTAPQRVGSLNPGFTAGYMGIIPQEWRSLLGGPAVTGQCCVSILGRTSGGPSLHVFNPDQLGQGSVSSTPLVYYPYGNLPFREDSQNEFFNTATMMGGVAFPAGTRSVLFIGRQGTGPWSYSGGPNAPPYRHQIWAYDANDLLAVKNGQKQPWEVMPYGIWPLSEMDNSGTATINYGGATFDPTTRRLYVTEAYGDRPQVHVYEIGAGSAAPQPTPTEVCGDGVDNDGDGQVDEGCPTTPPPPPPAEACGDGIDNDGDGQIDEGCAPAPPPASPEVCGDAIDNDGDGQIDEGCTTQNPPASELPPPGSPSRLYARVNDSTVSLFWSAPISGGPPTSYQVEAGVEPGQTLYQLTATETKATISPVEKGRYYVRVRAVNASGVSAPSEEIRVSVGCSWRTRRPRLRTSTNGSVVSFVWEDEDGCNGSRYTLSVGSSAGAADIATLSVDSVTEAVATAPPGTYFVRVQTNTEAGPSEPSEEVVVTIPPAAACQAPAFETVLSGWTDGNRVGLYWSPKNAAAANAADAAIPLSYVLEVGSTPGAANIGTFPLGRTTFLTQTVPPGSYYARVRPMDACGLGTTSNELRVTVP